MNLLIKPAIVLGAIIGAILGIILLIPYVQALSCLAFGFIGGAIIFYLKKNNLIGLLSSQDGSLMGAISGFVSVFAAAAVYIPISYITSLIFGIGKNPEINLISSFLSFSYSILALIMIVFFIAMLSSLFNAFSALLVSYIYERIESDIEAKEDRNDILIDD